MSLCVSLYGTSMMLSVFFRDRIAFCFCFLLKGREDGGDAEEDARRAAWQVQVQEESKNRVEDSHKVTSCTNNPMVWYSTSSRGICKGSQLLFYVVDGGNINQ